jgi:hypothetical protein
MKAIFILTVLFALTASALKAQLTFQKTFGLANFAETGRAIQQTDDSGFIIAGETVDLTNFKSKVYLVKTDVSGSLQWTKTFGDTTSQAGYSVQQTPDNGFIVAGYLYNAAGNADVYLLKTDSDGVLQWSKTFGGTDNDFGYSVLQTSDGGYIIAGSTKSFGAGSDDVYLIKTDSAGTLQWTKTFGGAQSDLSSSVQQSVDGGFVISGGTMSFGAGGQDIYLVKTDVSGNLQWAKTYGGALNDGSISAVQADDGGYVITGAANSFGAGSADFYLLKTDSAGALLWTKTFGGTQDEIAYSVQQTNDGGFIMTGYSRSFGMFPATDVYLVKTDSVGALQWSGIFGGANDDNSYAVKQATDGGFIITGVTDSFNHLYLVKADSNGSSACNVSIPNTLVNSGGIQGTGGLQGSGGVANTPLTQAGSGGIETTLCSALGINELFNEYSLTVFPNPFSAQATFQTSSVLENATLTVDNCFGQTIKQMKNIWGQTVVFCRDDLSAGLYFIRITQNNKVIATKKILIID